MTKDAAEQYYANGLICKVTYKLVADEQLTNEDMELCNSCGLTCNPQLLTFDCLEKM